MNRHEQTDLFFDIDPELKEKNERANFNVSVLGGKQSTEDAKVLGHKLAQNWFSVTTGGYKEGTMQAALEGANEAVKNLQQDPKNKDFLAQAHPTLKGITAERFAPDALATKGDNIKNEIAMGNYDVYFRLGKLIEDSDAIVILPGDTGTEVEVLATMHFEKKLKNTFKMESSPIIFVGEQYLKLLQDKFGKLTSKSNDIYIANNIEDAYQIVENIFNSKKTKEEHFDNLLQNKLIKNHTK